MPAHEDTFSWCGGEHDASALNASLAVTIYNFLKKGSPDEVLVVDVFSGDEITKKIYLEDSINLAKYLKYAGVSKGDVIGIISQNTWKYFTPVISAFYLGATVAFSNPSFLKDDLTHFLDTVEPKILFVSEDCYDKIQQLLQDYPFVEKVILFESESGSENSDALTYDIIVNKDIDEDFELDGYTIENDVAMILSSSGTTGMPKGVLISEKSLLYTLDLIRDPGGLAILDGSILISVLPAFHVFGLLLGLVTLVAPNKLILLRQFKPDVYLKAIQDYRVNFLPLIPALLQFIAKSPLVDKYDLSSVKDIICGSAPAGVDIEELVRKRINNVIPRQVYGCTEICGLAVCAPLGKVKSGSVGKLAKGVEGKIVHSETKEALSGPNNIGELYMRSCRLMKGYAKNVEETKKDLDEEGFLHTGDLGYFDEEGYLYIIGRIKEVIKYKGFQVAPVQLENILLQHPSVRDVAVVGKPDDRAGELPTAFVVKDSEVTEDELIELVGKHLHKDKQLHGGVIFVDQIPRNGVRKIDRKKLRELLKLY